MAILDDYQGVALELADWQRIRDRVEVESLRHHISAVDELIATLAPYDIVFAMRERTPLTADIIERLPRLKLICTAGPLNASIDVKAAQRRGVVVSGTGFTSHSTIELTWALILNVSRNILDEITSVRSGGWQVGLGADLHGRTIGIVGLGNTGQGVARIAHAFGMNVIAWSQNLTAETAAKHNVRHVDKDTLFREADVVTIHLRLSERSRGLIGSRELSLMKPSAILINTSRAPIVDQDALIAALRQRQIAGAGVDVYDIEPLPPDHPYRTLPNVTPTPHIGYVSRDLYRIFYQQTLENVEAWLAGNPIRPVMDWTEAGSGLPEWVMAQMST